MVNKQETPARELANSAELRENLEPTEAAGPIPRVFLVFIGAVLSFGGYYLIDEAPTLDYAGDRRSVQLEKDPVESTGESLYAARCAPCHQSDAKGVPGAFPPLAGSKWVTNQPKTVARILLLGLNGTIEVSGQTYNGVMPSQASLSDEDLAKLSTFIRSSFGNNASPVDQSLIAKVRSSLNGRKDPWTSTELLDLEKEDQAGGAREPDLPGDSAPQAPEK